MLPSADSARQAISNDKNPRCEKQQGFLRIFIIVSIDAHVSMNLFHRFAVPFPGEAPASRASRPCGETAFLGDFGHAHVSVRRVNVLPPIDAGAS